MARIKSLQGITADAEWQGAEDYLRSQMDQNALIHRRDLAHLLLERGRQQDVPEAIALMQIEVQNRRDIQALDTLAWALSRAGRWQEAQTVILEALEQSDPDAGIFYRAADIAAGLNQPIEAEKYIRTAYERDPEFNQQTRQRIGLVSAASQSL